MHWLSREWLCERLRLSQRQSYSLVRPGYGAAVSSDAILSLINAARRNIDRPFQHIPSDILTADELASAPELVNSGISSHSLLVFTRRESPYNRPPHLRLNKQTTRFVKSLFFDWLERRTREAERRGRRKHIV